MSDYGLEPITSYTDVLEEQDEAQRTLARGVAAKVGRILSRRALNDGLPPGSQQQVEVQMVGELEGSLTPDGLRLVEDLLGTPEDGEQAWLSVEAGLTPSLEHPEVWRVLVLVTVPMEGA